MLTLPMIFHVDLILYDLILHVVYFFFSALNILIIVTLLFLSSNYIFFFVICTSGSEASFVSSHWIFTCLLVCFRIFYWKLDMVDQVIVTEVNNPLRWGFMIIWLGIELFNFCCSYRCSETSNYSGVLVFYFPVLFQFL